MAEEEAPQEVKVAPEEVKFYYCLQVRSFKPGSNTVAEKNCQKLVELLRNKFGEKYVVVVYGETHREKPPVFIKVGASILDLEKFAEDQKFEVKAKVKYSEERGILYETFSVFRKKENIYVAPDVTLRSEELIDEGTPEDDVLLPYQKDEIVKAVLVDCLDIFMGERFKYRGLNTALRKKVIYQIFPLHLSSDDREFIYQNYLAPKSILGTPWVFLNHNHRYVEYWRGYFGEKIAMYQAFLSFYTTSLIFISIPGFMLAMAQYSGHPDNAGVPIYCMLVALWSVIWLQFWARKQSALAFRWNMTEYEEEEKELSTEETNAEETEYGFYNHDDWVDLDAYCQSRLSKEPKKNVPPEASIIRIVPKNLKRRENFFVRQFKAFFTNAILLTFVVGVIFATLGLLVFRLIIQRAQDFWGGVAGGVLNGVSIAILDQIYNKVAVALNDWQHHRTATEYEDSLIFKTFFFQFVNAYCSLFYIAFYKGNSSLFGVDDYCKNPDGSRATDCMTELATQLQSILLTRIAVGNLTELGIPWITYRYNLYKSRGGKITEKAKNADPLQREAEKPDYSTEKVSGTFYDYAELAIQFGYLVLFAPAFPLAPLLALLSNIIETSTDGFKLLNRLKKPFYQGASDLGPWYSVFNFLCVVAVLTNSLIIGFTSSQLDVWLEHPSTGTKWLVIIVIEHFVLGVLYLISEAVPDIPAWVRVKTAQIERIQAIEAEYQATLADWKSSVAEEKSSGTASAATLEREQYLYDGSEDDVAVQQAKEELEAASPPPPSDDAEKESRVY